MMPVLFTLAFVAACQLASTVRAMCVYNSTDIEIYVEFDCGIFCGNEWTTEPNNSYCRASTSGAVLTDFVGVTFDENVANVSIGVDTHGYVVMTQPSSDRIDVCAYHTDDSSAGCKSYNPQTGDVYSSTGTPRLKRMG